jgi:hypothetical protein
MKYIISYISLYYHALIIGWYKQQTTFKAYLNNPTKWEVCYNKISKHANKLNAAAQNVNNSSYCTVPPIEITRKKYKKYLLIRINQWQ